MGYRIKDGEAVSEGVKRIVLEQIDKAFVHLDLSTRNRDRAVHEARVCFKKIRAVLRLVAGELGPATFRLENVAYRDAGRQLATARDTTVIAGTLEALVDHYNRQSEEPDIKTLRKHLRKARAGQQQYKKQVLRGAAESLSVARQRVEGWQINGEGFSALAPGLRQVYKRGRRSYQRSLVERTTENLHEWRKQVKYLWYQVFILNPIWPKPLDAMARELNKLADSLSEDHDLALLRRTLLSEEQSLSDPTQIEKLVLLVDNRRIQLQTRAIALGARLYAEKPGSFTNRIGAYWEAWSPARVVDQVEAEQLTLAAYETVSAS